MGRQAHFPTMLYHASLHLFHPESTSLSLVQTLRITTLPSAHGPFSRILPAAYATPPTSPFTGSQGTVNRHCPILGHLLEGARCLLPFTGLALPQIPLQLKWWSLPLSSSDYTVVMVFFWTTKVRSVIFSTSPQGCLLSTWFIVIDVDLAPLVETVFVWVLQCKFTLPPTLSILYSLKGSLYAEPLKLRK